MPTQIKVPDLGESITEATVLRWTKQVGDAIKIGDVLLELETDKVNLEVGAEIAGVLTEIKRKDGSDVKVGEVLGEIDENGVAAEPAEKKPAKQAKAEKNEKKADAPKAEPAKAEAPKAEAPKPAPAAEAPRPAAPPRPSTPEEAPLEAIPRVEMQRPPAEIPAGPPVPPPSYSTSERRGATREERAKLSRRRRTIADRMVQAQQEAAILTTFNEIDMSAMMDVRARLKDEFKKRNGVNLGITTFFIKAAVIALREFPDMNAEMRGSDIIYKRYYDIGAAIDTPEGLVVPVVREADRLNFVEIEQTMKYFVDRALRGELSLDDLKGGTFTITNGGVFGSLMSTPILNPPQVGILGLHRIEKRPVVKGDQIVIRPMMYAALSYDHRLIDGRTAVQFLARIKALIEEPDRLLVEG